MLRRNVDRLSPNAATSSEVWAPGIEAQVAKRAVPWLLADVKCCLFSGVYARIAASRGVTCLFTALSVDGNRFPGNSDG